MIVEKKNNSILLYYQTHHAHIYIVYVHENEIWKGSNQNHIYSHMCERHWIFNEKTMSAIQVTLCSVLLGQYLLGKSAK